MYPRFAFFSGTPRTVDTDLFTRDDLSPYEVVYSPLSFFLTKRATPGRGERLDIRKPAYGYEDTTGCLDSFPVLAGAFAVGLVESDNVMRRHQEKLNNVVGVAFRLLWTESVSTTAIGAFRRPQRGRQMTLLNGWRVG